MIYVSIILTAVVYDGGRNGTDFGKLGRPVNPYYQRLSEQEPAAASLGGVVDLVIGH